MGLGCTHVADIDYETIITYTGGYDEMVMAKTRARTYEPRRRPTRNLKGFWRLQTEPAGIGSTDF